jgi:hypothetical protein
VRAKVLHSIVVYTIIMSLEVLGRWKAFVALLAFRGPGVIFLVTP